MLDNSQVQRILVVTAHPDDVDFGAAGTVTQWTTSGIAVTYCIITDGNAGGFDESVSRAEMATIRQNEQRAAGRAVGVEDVVFLGYQDGQLTTSIDLRRDISRVIRQVKPQRILCQSPQRNWDHIQASHPDHLAAGEAALCAVYPDSRNPFAHPTLLEEGLRPHVVDEVWLMAHPDAETAVDVTDTFDAKMAALHAHESQVGHVGDLDGFVREWLTRTAENAHLPTGRLAEVFKVISTAEHVETRPPIR